MQLLRHFYNGTGMTDAAVITSVINTVPKWKSRVLISSSICFPQIIIFFTRNAFSPPCLMNKVTLDLPHNSLCTNNDLI